MINQVDKTESSFKGVQALNFTSTSCKERAAYPLCIIPAVNVLYEEKSLNNK